MENKPYTILAIDDNRDNLVTLKASIKDVFPEMMVLTAMSGQEGISLAAAEEPDVILLDILMPGMDGYEVCRILKADRILKEIPVVFVTALKDDKQYRIQALESGGDAFLTKPIDQSELIAQIRAMLKIRAANKQKQNEKKMLAAMVDEKTSKLKAAHLETLKLLEELRKENKARRESEKSLQKSEELYRRIAENISDVIWTSDLNFHLKYVTPSIERLVGDSADGYLRWPLEKKFTQAAIESIRTALIEELKRESDSEVDLGRSRFFEVEHFKMDGSTVWVSMHVSFVRNEEKQIIGLQGVTRDITARKLAEKALLNSELRHRRLFETAKSGILILDAATGIITNVNPFLVDMLGYPADYYLSYAVWEIGLFHDYVKDQAEFARLREKRDINNESLLLKMADGHTINVEFVGNTYYVDDTCLIQCNFRDITDRKMAENALIHSHDLMRYIIEHNASAVAVHDKNLRYLYVSQRYLDDYNIKEDIIGKHHYDVFPDLLERHKKVHQQVLQGEIISCEEDMIQRRDGTVAWTKWACRPWYEADGSVGGLILYVENITERKQNMMELHKTKDYLEQLIANANAPIIVWDEHLNITKCNGAFQKLVGKKEQEILGKSIGSFIPAHSAGIILHRLQNIIRQKSLESTEFEILHKDRSIRTVLWSLATTYDLDGVHKTSTIAQGQDISERIAAEKKLFYLGYHDQLTGIYNRRFFEEEMKKLDVAHNMPLTIAVGDINGLKLINDSFGHTVGDELLQKAAITICKACRNDDIIARTGGDEFAIIFLKTSLQEALQIISRIEGFAAGVKVANVDLSISFGCDTIVDGSQSLSEALSNAENQMYKNKLHERSSLRSNIINVIMNALFEKSKRESKHSERVSRLCQAIASAMHFDKDTIKQIGIAGLVHDIGKIGVDEMILNKPGRLTLEERKDIERHPETGWRILSSSSEFSDLAQFVLEHHERWDGSGYPRGLAGENISIEARIIAIADSFDAMTSERSYHKGISREDAANELKRFSGTLYDPAMVETFIAHVLPTFETNEGMKPAQG